MSGAAEHVAKVEAGIIRAAHSDDPGEARIALRDAERLVSLYAGHAAMAHHSPAVRDFWQRTADRMSGIAAGINHLIEETDQ